MAKAKVAGKTKASAKKVAIRKVAAKARAKTSAPSNARRTPKGAPERTAATKPKQVPSQVEPVPAEKKRRKFPSDFAYVWTAERVEEVGRQLWDYIESTDCPTEAEFCYKYLIAHQRLGEFPLLSQLKELMFAKRQAYTTGRGLRLVQGDGPLGAFLAKLAANAGPFSLVDKLETESKSTVVTSYAIPDNGRGPKGRG